MILSTIARVVMSSRTPLTKEGPRTPAGRLALLALTATQLGLQAAAWISLARRDRRDLNGPKWFWFLASFINFAGPIAYLLGGRRIGR